MPLRPTSECRFQSELHSVLATLQCLSDYAAEQGDPRSASILGHAAALMELSLAAPIRPSVPTREQLARALV